jgi:hypothetical protein|nr:hypothetical protein [Kofleriaceae bacterium]
MARESARAWVLAAAGIVACGDNGSLALRTTAGSRLHPRFLTGGDARQLVGWHDDQLGADCNFEDYVANREHRCVPAFASPDADYYSNAACTVELAVSEQPSPAIIMSRAANTCAADPTFFAVGDEVTGAYQLFDGVCSFITTPLPFHMFAIGSAIDESVLAAAHEVPDDAGQLWLLGDDGAVVPWGGWDGHRAVAPTTTVAGSRWAPWIVAYDFGAFADAACTVPAVTKDADSARCPMDAALAFSSGSDVASLSFFELGRQLDTSYFIGSAGCQPSDDGVAVVAYERGAAIDSSALPAATSQLDGSGDVQVLHAVFDGHVVLQTLADPSRGGNIPPQPDAFVDRASGLACEPAEAADGVTRCFPPAGEDDYFTDAACTQLVMPVFDPTVATPAVFTYFAGDGATHARAPAGAAVAAPATMFAQPTVDADVVGPCVSTPPVAYVPLGDELPASRFAALALEVD